MPHSHSAHGRVPKKIDKKSAIIPELLAQTKSDIEQWQTQFTQQIQAMDVPSVEKDRLAQYAGRLMPGFQSLWQSDPLESLLAKIEKPELKTIVSSAYQDIQLLFDHYGDQFLSNLEHAHSDDHHHGRLERCGGFIKKIPQFLLHLLRSDGWDEIAASIAVTDPTTNARIKAVLFGVLTVPLFLGTGHAIEEFKEAIGEAKEALGKHKNHVSLSKTSKVNKVANAVSQGLEVVGYAGMLAGTFSYMMTEVSRLSELTVSGKEDPKAPDTWNISTQIQLFAVGAMLLGQVPMFLRASGEGVRGVSRLLGGWRQKIGLRPTPENVYELTQASNQDAGLIHDAQKRLDSNLVAQLGDVFFHHVPVGVGQAMLAVVNIFSLHDILVQQEVDESPLKSALSYAGLGLTLGGLAYSLLGRLLPKDGRSQPATVKQKLLPRAATKQATIKKSNLGHQQVPNTSDAIALVKKSHQSVTQHINSIDTLLNTQPSALQHADFHLAKVLKQVLEIVKTEDLAQIYLDLDKQSKNTHDDEVIV